jgi:hypothetical protein
MHEVKILLIDSDLSYVKERIWVQDISAASPYPAVIQHRLDLGGLDGWKRFLA